MTVEYFDCDYCKETTCDHSDNYQIDVEGFEIFTICPSCVVSFCELLYLEEPRAPHFYAKNEDTIIVCEDIWDDLSEWKNKKNVLFGVKMDQIIFTFEELQEKIFQVSVKDLSTSTKNYVKPNAKFIAYKKDQLAKKKRKIAKLEEELNVWSKEITGLLLLCKNVLLLCSSFLHVQDQIKFSLSCIRLSDEIPRKKWHPMIFNTQIYNRYDSEIEEAVRCLQEKKITLSLSNIQQEMIRQEAEYIEGGYSQWGGHWYFY